MPSRFTRTSPTRRWELSSALTRAVSGLTSTSSFKRSSLLTSQSVPPAAPAVPSRGDWALLCGITPLAVLIHGYHPTAEDAEIYLPGILKLVHPSLFPRNAAFFQSHAGMTLFPNLIADSIR